MASPVMPPHRIGGRTVGSRHMQVLLEKIGKERFERHHMHLPLAERSGVPRRDGVGAHAGFDGGRHSGGMEGERVCRIFLPAPTVACPTPPTAGTGKDMPFMSTSF